MYMAITKELEKLQYLKRRAETTMSSAPEGSLRCAVNKGCFQYYQGKKYLGKNKKEYIQQIAQKEYCQKLRNEISEYERSLEIVRNLYEEKKLEEVYEKLHPARKALVHPLVKSVENIIKEFEGIDYDGKSFDENDTTEYYTTKGERVRSKSEKIIADELFRAGIPYKYEMPLELKIWNKSIVVYPDFTAINPKNGRRWLIEHLGMMDNEGYYDSSMFKLDTYEKNNILLGRDLIILHETSTTPLNTKVLEEYINEYLL